MSPSPDNAPALTLAALAAHLQQQPHHRITFAQYMDWVLYDRQEGYYSRRAKLGAAGDFFTSAHLGPDFGQLLGVQVQEMWQLLGQPDPFTVLEMGAGDGTLAADLLAWLHQEDPPLWQTLHYGIVERSPTLIQQQQAKLAPWAEVTRWCDWDDLESGSLVGCCLSNELVDAFAVHRVQVQRGTLLEAYVAWDPMILNLREVWGPLSTPAIADYFADLGLDLTQPPYPDGYITEVNLQARHWLATLADRLDCGYVITIDYGYRSDRYYQPSRHQGTLQAYQRHQHHSDPYAQPGHQDLTAHVNFSALEQWGQGYGLQTLGCVPQALFLMALGLGDRLAALGNPATAPRSISDLLQRRDALHQLMDMASGGLGQFKVLIQSKGSPPATLRGLSLGDCP